MVSSMEISAVLAVVCGYHMSNRSVRMRKFWMMFLLLGVVAAKAQASGHLVVERAWIRTAPPGAMMLAGYATIRNEGDASLTLTGADSADFSSISIHESAIKN